MKRLFLIFLLLPVLCFSQGIANRAPTRFILRSINGLSSASILIATTENGTETFYPTLIYASLAASNLTGFISATTVSIGTNSPNYNNILGTTTLTGLSAVNSMLPLSLTGSISTVPPNTGIYCKITAAVPVSGTTFTLHLI